MTDRSYSFFELRFAYSEAAKFLVDGCSNKDEVAKAWPYITKLLDPNKKDGTSDVEARKFMARIGRADDCPEERNVGGEVGCACCI